MIIEEELVNKYPHLFKLGNDVVLEMYVDHHILSTFRLCEAKFTEEILNCIHGREQRYWSLEFGAFLHECLELYYNNFIKESGPPPLPQWLDTCKQAYIDYNLDYFKPPDDKLVKNYRADEKKWAVFKGWPGVAGLLTQYYGYYLNQRIRVVATEVSFGINKEVYLGEVWVERVGVGNRWGGCFKMRVYLSGRIDLLVDNGYKIGPVDHKHTARFDGYESDDYDPHEGITGYIFAMNEVLKSRFPDNPHKICRDGWIYHLSAQDVQPRFKATPISKTPQQLEDFRLRQLSTVKRMMDVILGVPPVWNTYACNNIFFSACPFRELHRQPTEQRNGTIQQFYQIKEAWNPAKPPKIEKRKNTTSDPNSVQQITTQPDESNKIGADSSSPNQIERECKSSC